MVPRHLHIPKQHYTVISNPLAGFSDKASARKIATTKELPHIKASCESQDLYLGGGEVKGVVPILPGVPYLLL